MPNDLTIGPSPGPMEVSDAALEILDRQAKVDSLFRELALRDTSRVQDQVSELLASKIEEVKAHRPDLTDLEAVMVASRVLKQLIRCYLAAIDQLT